jgi:hypothetical protein
MGMIKTERPNRIRSHGVTLTAVAIVLAACGSNAIYPAGGAGGTTSIPSMGGSGGIAVSAGGTIGSGAGGMMTGAGGMMAGSGGMMTGSGGAGGGASCHAAGTLQVTNTGTSAYVIDGASNPTLTFCRGSTYVFAVNATGHPFYINSVQGTGTSNAYSSGVTGNGTDSRNVTFAVPTSAPATLFYNCSLHTAMTGTIHIVN